MIGHMEYIRRTYRVPAKRGRRVRVWYIYRRQWRLALDGAITSARRGGPYLFIDGAGPYHPTYGIEYLRDDGSTLLDTRTPQETPR